MSDEPRNLVVICTHGIDHELSTIAFTMANGGMTAGMKVSVFLVSSGVDLARKGAFDTTHVHPFDSLKELVDDFLKRGGTLWACTPCANARAYTQEDLIDGVIITGAGPMHALIKEGAATISL